MAEFAKVDPGNMVLMTLGFISILGSIITGIYMKVSTKDE